MDTTSADLLISPQIVTGQYDDVQNNRKSVGSTNPFQFITLEELQTIDSPLVYIMTLDHVQEFAEDNFGSPLTDEEICDLPYVLCEPCKCDLLYEAISILRPERRRAKYASTTSQQIVSLEGHSAMSDQTAAL